MYMYMYIVCDNDFRIIITKQYVVYRVYYKRNQTQIIPFGLLDTMYLYYR